MNVEMLTNSQTALTFRQLLSNVLSTFQEPSQGSTRPSAVGTDGSRAMNVLIHYVPCSRTMVFGRVCKLFKSCSIFPLEISSSVPPFSRVLYVLGSISSPSLSRSPSFWVLQIFSPYFLVVFGLYGV